MTTTKHKTCAELRKAHELHLIKLAIDECEHAIETAGRTIAANAKQVHELKARAAAIRGGR